MSLCDCVVHCECNVYELVEDCQDIRIGTHGYSYVIGAYVCVGVFFLYIFLFVKTYVALRPASPVSGPK